jgi:hypothetical protein
MRPIIGFIVKPNNKWWIVVLWYLRLIPRKVWLRFLYKSGRYDDVKVDVNQLGALKDARDVKFFDDVDKHFYTLVRLTHKGGYKALRRIHHGTKIERRA